METQPYDLLKRVADETVLDRYSSGLPRFLVLLDADALLSSIDNHCRTSWPSRLLRMAQSSLVRVFAEDHVYGETYRGFARLAATSSASVEEMRQCFEEEYLPVIWWVATDGDGIVDDRVKLVTDDTDVPTAELASLIAPCLVLSEDRSLRRPGFAPAAWREAAGHGAAIVRAEGEREGTMMAVGFPPALVIGGGIKLGEKVGLPWWASVGVMAAGGYVVLRSPERRTTVWNAFSRFMEMLVQLLEEVEARERAGLDGLRGVMFSPGPDVSLKQQVATVLARSQVALLAQGVQERIAIKFDGDAPTVDEVRAVLREASEFHVVDRYRWQLGRLSGPWRQEVVA